MIVHAYDRSSSALMVHIWGASTDGAVNEFVTRFRQLDEEAMLGTMPITIIDVDPQAQRLNAQQRQTISETFATALSPVHLVAIVMTSAVHRGVGKVIAWLSPAGERRRARFHATVLDAFRWCERERGSPIPTLRLLHDRVVAVTAETGRGRVRKSTD
jgi:hypothetical protein